MERLRTVEAVIEAVGGDGAAAQLAGGVLPSAVSNWKARRRIPTALSLIFSRELSKLNMDADPAVFGLRSAGKAT